MRQIFTFFILLITITPIYTQNLHVYDVNSDEYPLIKAKFYVTDLENNQVKDFQIEDFRVVENQIDRFIDEITCSDENIFNKISTILAIDVSRSMTGERLEWTKFAATKWVTAADSLNEETAITTFSDNALLYSDFINDSTILKRVIDTLEIRDGTNYKNAFLDPYAGALDVARRAKYLPVIVFLTDGVGLTDFSQKEIIDKAKEIGAIIYAISIDISLPKEMKQVAEATGGQYFELINSQDKLTEAYNNIRQIAINTIPCEISWFTEGCILGRLSQITYNPYPITKEVSYDAPDEKFPEFEYVNDEFAVFECEIPNTYTLRLKARNDDIEINDIFKVGNVGVCKDFSARFVGKTTPFTLNEGETVEINITYTPTSSEFNFCEFEIDASSCLNNSFYAVSNCLNSPPSNVLIDIIRPNGGEVFKANTKENVFWTGTAQNRDIQVEFSLDSGKSWNLINYGKLYNNSVWNVPNVESDQCLVKVKQMSNDAGKLVYSINIDSSEVTKISWNNSGNVFATISDTNSVKFISSITGRKLNEIYIETDTSRIIDIQYLPDGARLYVTTEDGLYLMNLLNKKSTFINELTGEIELSYDDNYITVTNKDSATVYNLNSRVIERVFKPTNPNMNISGLAISHNSNSIAICTDTDNFQDSIYIYTKSNNWSSVTEKTFADPSEINFHSYKNIEWSFDDKYLILSSKIKTLQVLDIWDVGTSSKVTKEFDPSTTDITDIAASEYENYFVTSDAGYDIIVWQILEENNIVSLSKKFEFKSSIVINNDIEWSPDGTRFAIGSSTRNKESKQLSVYSLKSYPEVEATSDTTFSIVKDTYTVKAIDLGTELIGLTKDSTITNLINYNYEYAFNIDSVNITGSDSDYFSVSNSPNLPTKFNKDTQASFTFSFTPNREGNHNAILNIYSQFGKKTAPIIAEGVRPLVQLEDYNFGEVLITKDSIIKKYAIKNNGSSNIKINKIFVVGPSDQFFDMIDNSQNVINSIENIELSPNQQYELTVRFSPLLARLENARIRVEYVDKQDEIVTKHLNLYGEGINPKLVSDESIVFDDVVCDDSLEKEIILYNKGNGSLRINSILSNSQNFIVISNIQNIEENDSAIVKVKFVPKESGELIDSILVFTNELENSTRKIYLFGRNLKPEFEVIGNNQLIGVDDNQVINGSFRIINTGKIRLKWNPPYVSSDGKITVTSIVQKTTLVGDTSVVNFRFDGGQKGESFSMKFAPIEPHCADSVEIKIEVKNTKPTLYLDFDTDYLLVCDDSLKIKIPLINNGEEPLEITNIRFEGGDNSLYEVDKKVLTLQESETDTVIVTFVAQNIGVFDTEFTVISNDSKAIGGKTKVKLRVKKDISDFEINETVVDFIYVGLTNPGVKQFRIRNKGSLPTKFKILPVNNFNIVSIIPPITPVNAESVVSVIYNGPNDSSHVAQLFVQDSCGNVDSLQLNVVAANNGYAILKLDEQRRKIGETFDYIIKMQSSNKLQEAGVESISGILKFNYSLMIPTNEFSDIKSGVREVPFTIDNIVEGSELIIRMQALWGDDSCSTVAIDSLRANGITTEIDLDYTIGSICITDLCYEGGVRLIDLSKTLDASIKLNQSTQSQNFDLTLNLIEKGNTKIDIINTNGAIVKNISNNFESSGIKYFKSDISDLPNGVYFVKIETPSITLVKRLILLK